MEAGAEIVVIEAETGRPAGGLFGAIAGTLGGALGQAVRTGTQVGLRATESAVDAVLGSQAVQETAERIMSGPAMTSAIDALLSSEVVDMIADEVARRQLVQKITVAAIEAGEMGPIVDAILEREELWVLVQTIAESPAVIDAVRQQGFGFADQVGDEVRGRSRTADQVIARTARTFIGRREKLDAQLPTDQEEKEAGRGGDGKKT